MPERMRVRLLGAEVGEIQRTESGNLQFQYNSDYGLLQTPISLSMPVGFVPYPKYRVLPFIQGLLPDNPNALRAIGSRFGVDPNDSFEILKHVGSEAAGALEFISESKSSPQQSQVLDESSIADRLIAKLDEYRSGRSSGVFMDRLSLAGAQPKLILSFDGRDWRLPGEDHISTHILKPVPDAWQNLDVIEHLTLRAASKLGLQVAKSEIREFSGVKAFVTERFDRKTELGKISRIHQEDLCQALSVKPEKKYQMEGGPSVKKIGRLLSTLPIESDRQHSAQQFFKQLVFNVFARCADAHAKNYSLVLEGNSVRLSPLYDSASTVLYSIPQESAMSIGGEYEFRKITNAGLIGEASHLHLDSQWALEVIESTREAILDAFSDAALEIRETVRTESVTATTREVLDRLAESLG